MGHKHSDCDNDLYSDSVAICSCNQFLSSISFSFPSKCETPRATQKQRNLYFHPSLTLDQILTCQYSQRNSDVGKCNWWTLYYTLKGKCPSLKEILGKVQHIAAHVAGRLRWMTSLSQALQIRERERKSNSTAKSPFPIPSSIKPTNDGSILSTKSGVWSEKTGAFV